MRMTHPRPVAPAELKGVARASWTRLNKTVSGAPARSTRLSACSSRETRVKVARTIERQLGGGLYNSVNVATGAPPLAVGGCLPILRRKIPAVCLIDALGLHPHSPSPHIVHALRRLRGSNSPPYSLLVHQLRNFDDDCLDALLAVLKRHPRICALNIGEATRGLSYGALERLVAHLQSPFGARIVCLYLCDTATPIWAKAAVKAATGRRRREATEAEARAILADGKASPQALRSAWRLVPWRDPQVWAALANAPLPSDATGTNVKWAMPTWHPKTPWSALG